MVLNEIILIIVRHIIHLIIMSRPKKKDGFQDYAMIPVYPEQRESANAMRKGGESWHEFFDRMVFGKQKGGS